MPQDTAALKAADSVRRCCTAAAEDVDAWREASTQLAGVLAALESQSSLCCAGEGLMEDEATGVFGPLAALPGCVSAARSKAQRETAALAAAVRAPLDDMKAAADALGRRSTEAQQALLLLGGGDADDAVLRRVEATTGHPLAAYVAALKAASAAFRLQYATLRAMCTFAGAGGGVAAAGDGGTDARELRRAAGAAAHEAEVQHAVDLDSLYCFYPSVS
eukprot:Rhum_TRINITY_DN23568_c0_g1::Rhum_TRINITY_DN23568_c0_g1_i1::g.178308::m.178308